MEDTAMLKIARIEKMKLRYRILLGYAVPLVLFLGVSAQVYMDVSVLSESSKAVRNSYTILTVTRMPNSASAPPCARPAVTCL